MTQAAGPRMPALQALRAAAPDELKTVGRRLVDRVGHASAAARLLPTFLVVGAQRAGTTSLHRALMGHPQVVPPLFHKGVHYFDVGYTHDLAWYRGHFPLARLAALRTRGSGPAVTFETSGYYMHHPVAPERIARDLPGVRLVAMLRDPVERAYSAHRHELDRGFETEPFVSAIARETTRLAGETRRLRDDPAHVSHAHRHHSYVDRGHYAEQLRRLFDLVGRERVHVLFSEDFFERPEPVFAELLQFLELSAWTPDHFDRWNARPRASMDAGTRAALENHFRPHDDELATLLGRALPWRR